MATKELISRLYEKAAQGSDFSGPYFTGADFKNVILNSLVSDTSTKTYPRYNLEQFYNNYINFVKNLEMVYTGADQPANDHIHLWIQTHEDLNA